jgi:NitT/TauT family transport system permease protein
VSVVAPAETDGSPLMGEAAPEDAPVTPPPPRGGRLRALLPPLGTLAVVLGIWNAFSYVLLKPEQRFLMPPPHKVVQVGVLDAENLAEILRGLWETTQVAITGLLISIVLGTLLAVAMSQARWVERSIYPYAVVLQTIPIIALVPLIGFWFEFNFRSRVIVCVLISLFPIITNTLFGLKSADRQLHDLFTLHGAGRVTRLRKLLVPAALPAVFTGFRISAGLAVIGAIVGDFFFRQGEPGIGRLLDVYRNRLESEELFTAIFFSSLLGLVVFWVFGFLANRALRSWHESADQGH